MCDAAAHAQGLVKVVITQRVVSGKKVIFNWAKLYDPMLGVQFVVNAEGHLSYVQESDEIVVAACGARCTCVKRRRRRRNGCEA